MRQLRFFKVQKGRPGAGDTGVAFVAVIEVSKKLVILLLRELIILVIVAARTTYGETQPDGAQRFHSIHHGGHAPLFLIRAAFGVGEGLPVERSGQPLQAGGVGQEIAGELFDGELVKWQVGIDGVDHPIAVAPGVHARAILFIAVTVRIAGFVQPMTAPAFTKVRRG